MSDDKRDQVRVEWHIISFFLFLIGSFVLQFSLRPSLKTSAAMYTIKLDSLL